MFAGVLLFLLRLPRPPFCLSEQTRGRESLCPYLLIEAPALRARFYDALPLQDLPQTLVLRKSLPPPPREGVQAHELRVSPLVCLLARYYLLQRLGSRLVFPALLV